MIQDSNNAYVDSLTNNKQAKVPLVPLQENLPRRIPQDQINLTYVFIREDSKSIMSDK